MARCYDHENARTIGNKATVKEDTTIEVHNHNGKYWLKVWYMVVIEK
jgi:hypothetical protein